MILPSSHRLATYRPRITFQDTNVVGNVYFLSFFRWQAECRDQWIQTVHPDLDAAIRSGQLPLRVTHWETRFTDPVGATIGDEVQVTIEFQEAESDYCATARIERIADDGNRLNSSDLNSNELIGTGSCQFTTSREIRSIRWEECAGPCYVFNHRCPRIAEAQPLELIGWQGKCRELFLADHAPQSLAEVARGQLALQTTSASLDIEAGSLKLDRVRVEMRLERIKCGQLSVRFDYFSIGDDEELKFATGHQSMSTKRYSATGIIPCPLPRDMLLALCRFTDSEAVLEKIHSILDFAQGTESSR